MTRLTYETIQRHTIATGVTSYAFPFKITAADHIKVHRLDDDLTPVSTYLLNADYSVSGVNGANGGSITFLTLPPSGTEILLELDEPMTQESTYPRGGNFDGPGHEAALDRAMAAAQRAFNQGKRSLKLSYGDELQLPPLASLTGSVLKVVPRDGGGFRIVPIDTADLETLALIADELNALSQLVDEIGALAEPAVLTVMDRLGQTSVVANMAALGNQAMLDAMAAIKADFDLGANSTIKSAPQNAADAQTAKDAAANSATSAATAKDEAETAAEDAELSHAAAAVHNLEVSERFLGGPYASVEEAVQNPFARIGSHYFDADDGTYRITSLTPPESILVSAGITAGQTANLAAVPAIRDEAAANTLDLARRSGKVIATGTNGSYIYTSPNGDEVTALADGLVLSFIANHKNPAGVTLNVDGIGARPVRKLGGAHLVDGDLNTGLFVEVVYLDGVFNIISPLASPTIAQLSSLRGNANEFPYWSAPGVMQRAALSPWGREILGYTDEVEFRSKSGLAVGVNIQPFNQRLTDLTTVQSGITGRSLLQATGLTPARHTIDAQRRHWGKHNQGVSGYVKSEVKDPDTGAVWHMMKQWGQISLPGDSGQTILWPEIFAAQPRIVGFSTSESGFDNRDNSGARAVSISSIYVYNGAGTNQVITYFAEGPCNP